LRLKAAKKSKLTLDATKKFQIEIRGCQEVKAELRGHKEVKVKIRDSQGVLNSGKGATKNGRSELLAENKEKDSAGHPHFNVHRRCRQSLQW